MKTLDSCTVVHSQFTSEILQSEPLIETKMCITASFEGHRAADACISLQKTSSPPPLTFSGILVWHFFRVFGQTIVQRRAQPTHVVYLLNEFLHSLPQHFEVPVRASVDLFMLERF